MDTTIEAALHTDLTIDLTTTGRKTGLPRRIEIWMLSVDGRLCITGTPGPRGWYANLLHDPSCIIHLKQRVRADIAATARPIITADERSRILLSSEARWYREQGDDLDFLLSDAPLVEISPRRG